MSACELSLKALTQASNFMTAVANKLPRSALTTVKDVVSASAITSALDSRLTKVLDAVKYVVWHDHLCTPKKSCIALD